MLRLYDYLPSGNGYKVRLLLTQLAIPFELVERDIIKGETRTADFLVKFPNGRIPAVEFDEGKLLFESNAIISYFAEDNPTSRPCDTSCISTRRCRILGARCSI